MALKDAIVIVEPKTITVEWITGERFFATTRGRRALGGYRLSIRQFGVLSNYVHHWTVQRGWSLSRVMHRVADRRW